MLSPLAFGGHHLSGQNIAINLFHSLPFEEFGFRLFLALTLTDNYGQHSVSRFDV